MKHVEPRNQTVEMNVLGGMMNGNDMLYEALATLSEAYFAHEETRVIFRTIAELANGERVTCSMVKKKLGDNKTRAMAETADKMYTDVDGFQVDVETLKRNFISRGIYETAQKALQGVATDEDPDRIIQFIEHSISSFYLDDKGENMVHARDTALDGLEEFMNALEQPELFHGIPFSYTKNGYTCGFPDLDAVFKGAQGGDLFLLAAKTGEGKTALACNLVRIFSMLHKYSGYYLNTEMKIKELRSRIIAPLANVTVDELTTAKIEGTPQEREAKIDRISKAFALFNKSNIILSRIPTLTSHKIKALARQAKNRFGNLDYIIVDYLGRLEMDYGKGMQEYQIMFHNIQKLKELAIELDIPVFVLAQRNFDGELEGAKKIANECDGVLFFQPIEEEDVEEIQRITSPAQATFVNYKLVKRKVRRSDRTRPIYVEFDKAKQIVNETQTTADRYKRSGA